jgi:hypothetical protein
MDLSLLNVLRLIFTFTEGIMKWCDTPLFHALKSLDLNRRLVSASLDGSLAEPTVDDNDTAGVPGGIDDPHYFSRSVLWRIFLSVLTVPYTGTSIDNVVASWCPRLFALRAQYASQKQQFHQCYPEFRNVDDVASTMEDVALAEVDEALVTQNRQSLRGSVGLARLMLSMSFATNSRRSSIGKGKSPLESCSDQVAEDIISLDIKRTYLTNDPEVPHHSLFNILTVWRWLHPVIGYHQGMHEIAGVCLQVLSRAAVAMPEDCPPEVAECANATFREADAYYLFDGIMSTFGLAELFHSTTVVGSQNLRTNVGNFGEGDNVSERPSMTALESVCEHVAFHMLRDHSSTLYHHLANTDMFDKLLVFLPRWIRNMFTRELTMPQLVIVWDGVFGVFYHDEVQREDRKRRQVGGSSGSSASFRRSTTIASVYAGTKDAGSASQLQMDDDDATGSHVPFSRTTLGVVVALLLHIEDDLLELDDDFSLLRRLTSTPIVSPMVDASWIMNNAMAIANTRPLGVIPIHRRRESIQTAENVSRAAATASATRLTKEELMLQQRSVALVVERVTKRIAECMDVDLDDTTSSRGNASVRLTEPNVAVIRGALRELQCVADRLSFL